MTVITKLTCRGFKSFAKRTEVPFLSGFNTIVGANGHGKSNVVDAICFVLGKSSAKGLRAEKSANLIYNGGKKGKGASEAEVSIYFDNSKKTFPYDDKEVKITRIVKKTGNSTYKINDQKMTRQQVVDVLRAARIDPDGHNIILQGDVIRFTDMKPVDRREIIEDVAGISVFEEKKKKAMSELDRVQDRLNEAEIILTEREKTLKDLKKDRDQALQYKELEKNIERNKATRIHLLLKSKKNSLEEVNKKYDSFEGEIKKYIDEIKELKTEIFNSKQEILGINKELTEKGDKRQRELAKEIENLKTQVIKDSSRKDVVENELRKLKERTKSLEASIKEHQGKVSELKKSKQTLTKDIESGHLNEQKVLKKISEFKQKHGIADKDDISKQIENLDQRIDEEQRQLLAKEEEKQQLIRKRDRVEYEVDNLSAQIEKIQELKKEGDQKVVQLKKDRKEFQSVTKALSDALNESGVYSTQLSTARTKLMDAKDEHARLRIKNISIKEKSSGDLAIRRILEAKQQGVYGTVGDLGQVPSDYALALEIAAGTRMKSVVVSSDQVASKCIQTLKDNKAGVVTFLPINKLRERMISDDERKLAKAPGVLGLAIDLVKYDPKFRNVFKYVFAGTLVVQDLATARKIGIGRARMVTLDGDLVEGSGAMVGGYRRKTAALGFQQKEVSEKLERLEREISKLDSTVGLLENKKTDNEEAIIRLRERKAVLEAQIKAAEVKIGTSEDLGSLKEKKRELTNTIKEFSSQLKGLESEAIAINKNLSSLRVSRQKERDRLSKLTSSKFTKELEDFEISRQGIKEGIIKAKSEINSLDNQIELYTSEKDKTFLIIKNNDKEFESFTHELKGLNEDLAGNKDILKIKEANQRKFYSEYKELFNKRNKAEKEIQKKDNVVIRNEEKLRATEGRRNDVSIKKAVLSGEVDGLEKEFEQYKEVSLRRGMDLPQLELEIKNFENTLRNLGNVNLRALEIYEKVYEEYQVLIEKFDKLKLEKEDVLKLMYEIEGKKQESFMKTFKLLERNFKEIFSMLTTKGNQAELVIENPESLFEGGIDVRVKLPSLRAKYLDLKSLSGGEKTLTALAFIFAIQEFEPSWFYLMDEVDAALDKKNSELLSKLIRKYSSGSQYIVISHNDAIISEAETIFGVTMQDGMSKMLSLKV